jgi:hypothetical protein
MKIISKRNKNFKNYSRRACQDCTLGNIEHCSHSKCVMADGVKRGFLSINFELPGPAIHVCKGDVILVDFDNDAEGIASRFENNY